MTDTDDGSSVTLQRGAALLVTLDSNATTGYIWQLTRNPAPLKQEGPDSYDALRTDLMGAGGTQTFTFLAMGAGRVHLAFVYVRPWEQPPEPAGTFAVDVTVR